jgi:hypothetical protein
VLHFCSTLGSMSSAASMRRRNFVMRCSMAAVSAKRSRVSEGKVGAGVGETEHCVRRKRILRSLRILHLKPFYELSHLETGCSRERQARRAVERSRQVR